ncbi:MAG: hypothetical protein ACKO5Y_05370 [Bacteroidota bacterium]
MKKLIFCVLIILGYQISYSQPELDFDESSEKSERIESLKRAYMTQELNLSVSESEKFWPVFNESEQQVQTLKKDMRLHLKALHKGDLSDEDIMNHVMKLSEIRKLEVDLELALIKNTIPILGIQRAARIPMIEHEFHRMLIEKFKDHHKKDDEKHEHGGKHR